MAENLDPDVIAQLNREYREHNELIRDSTLMGKAKADAEKAEKEMKAASLIVFRNSIKAVEDFTRTLATQESSFQKFTTLGTQVVDTAASMAKEMGGLTGAMGVALQAAIKVAHAMAVQADAIVKTKDQIAKFGAVGELSSKELQDLANKAGYFSLNMNKLYSAAGKAGGDLLIFSKNMSQGVKTFAEMASFGGGDALDETLAKFNMLGIGADELREYQSDYVKYLAASGVQLNANQKTQAALTKGSLEYTKNVLELSALTGKDVDTVKKKQQEAQASLDIMIRHNKMRAQADELISRKDFDGAKAIEDQIANEQAIIKAISAQFSSSMTASVRSAIATGGVLNDLNRGLGNMAIDPRVFIEMAKSAMTPGEAGAAAIEKIAGGVKYAGEIFGESIIQSAGSQDELGKIAGFVTEDLQQLAKGAGEARKRQEEVAADIAKKQEDILKSQQNTFLQLERAALAAGDKIISSVNPFMIDMKTIMKNFQEQMDKSWSFIKEKILAPANQYVKDVFGVDLEKVLKIVTGAFESLVTATGNLWTKFTSLNSVLSQVLIGLGGLVGGIAGFAVGGLPGMAAGAAAGAAGMAYILPSDGPKEPKPTTSEASNAWGKVGIPGKKPSDKFDSGTGSGWDNEPTGSKGTSTNTRNVSPSSGLADELAQGQRNLGKSTSPSSAASKTSTGSLKGDTSGLDSELQKRLMAAAEVYGKPLTINSGFRSYAKQKEMWDESVAAKRPGIGPGGMLVAKPGSSAHERGMAVDIQEAKNDPKAVEALKSQGFVQPYGKADEVHFELAGLQNAAKSGSSSAPIQTASAKPVIYEMPKPQPAAESNPTTKSETSSSPRGLSSSGSSVSNSEETYARMLYDIKDSITTKMQEMIDKVAESNDLLGKIMRHST